MNEVILTPIEEHGNHLVKRDDLFQVAGVRGGKARTCWALAQGARGLVTAGSRQSPQVNIVAHVAKELGVPCEVHVPSGELTPELESASQQGAVIIQHRPGYNSVIVARAREAAKRLGYAEIPFGMECWEAVHQTKAQVANIPSSITRIVIPVGSGMSLAGVLWGLKEQQKTTPVLGIVVGADPKKRLNKYAPEEWEQVVTLIPAGVDYHKTAQQTWLGDLELDPIYEAKCLPFLCDGDLLWIVGIRQSSTVKSGTRWDTFFEGL